MRKKEIDGKTFCINGSGNLVAEESIRAIDVARDELVCTVADELMDIRQKMQDTKLEIKTKIEMFVKIAAAQYGVKLGGKSKGNLSMTSFDGSYRITLANSETIGFTEEIWAAKEILDEFIAEQTSDSNQVVKELTSRAFKLKQGKLDSREILKLRTYNIHGEEKWDQAMEIISQSMRIESCQPCFRLHIRSSNGWDLVNMDFTTI